MCDKIICAFGNLKKKKSFEKLLTDYRIKYGRWYFFLDSSTLRFGPGISAHCLFTVTNVMAKITTMRRCVEISLASSIISRIPYWKIVHGAK